MKKTFSNILLFTLLGGVFLSAVIINNSYLKGFNADLTDKKIYSLSQGSQAIAKNLSEPITLYYFFSESTSSGMTVARDYAARVNSLLHEYERLSNGKINLEIIDPQPFSEAEDRAASFGLTAAPTGVGQDTIYFGLAGTNSLDDAVVIGFFDPQKEAFLEYDISSLIYQLNDPEPVQLTIVSDLQIAGAENPISGQSTPAYVLYQQLQEFFEVSVVSSSDVDLPSNTQVLMLWHPQNLNDALLAQVDQFIMSGGKTLALVDPHYESDLMAQMGGVGANSSSLPLLESYGVAFDNTQVVLDALIGLEVRNNQGGVDRHLGFLGLSSEQINRFDITSGDLNTINGASFGTLTLTTNSKLKQSVLLSSSKNTSIMAATKYAKTKNPALLNQDFLKVNRVFTLAARYTGTASSHLINGQNIDLLQDPKLIRETDQLNLVVVADADIAADRFWVQQSNFFGQTVVTPFANNGDFLTNVLQNFAGSEDLIGIRSRGAFMRPFTRVQAIQLVAEEQFREQEKRLQAELKQTEQELSQLQTTGNTLALTPEQQMAIDQFTQQKIAIRKSLREVQFQLEKDIDALGNQLKLVNIVAAPLLLVFLLFILAKLMRKRAPKQVTLKTLKSTKNTTSKLVNQPSVQDTKNALVDKHQVKEGKQ